MDNDNNKNGNEDHKPNAPWGGGILLRSPERVAHSLKENGVIFYSHVCSPKKFGQWCSICGGYIGPLQKSVAWTSYKYNTGFFIICDYCDIVASQEMQKLVQKLKKMLGEHDDTDTDTESENEKDT